MNYKALYRKWRPVLFDDVIGQEHIVRTLKNEIKHNKIAHAYLFCGTRGTGKTSTAKVFSRAVNCTNPKDGNPCNECESCTGILNGTILDVFEIDAASNNGVDNIRALRDEANYSASYTKYKVYIIDEVHMLSTGAFNALLKILEEPPEHVIFILATTETQKVPATILSRCQRFDFKRITLDDIVKRLRFICEAENISITESAAYLIASLADGGMRDAISILDQCSVSCDNTLTEDNISSVMGITEHSVILDIAKSIAKGDAESAVLAADSLVKSGKNIVSFVGSLVDFFRNMLLSKILDDPSVMVKVSPEKLLDIKKVSESFSVSKLSNCIKIASELNSGAKFTKNLKIMLEVALIDMTLPELNPSVDSILERLEALENMRMAMPQVKDTPSEPEPKEEANEEPKIEEAKPSGNKVKKNWAEILAFLKKQNKPAILANLLMVSFIESENNLTLVFPSGREASMDIVKKNADILKDAIRASTNTDFNLLFEIKNTGSKPVKKDAFEELLDIEGIQKL